jgi:hypothetical protein
MQRRALRAGRLKAAGYDERTHRLEIEFANGDLFTYKGVQHEVAQRLFAAPNAAAYWEDRIADEYPLERGKAGGPDARGKLDDLFGKP